MIEIERTEGPRQNISHFFSFHVRQSTDEFCTLQKRQTMENRCLSYEGDSPRFESTQNLRYFFLRFQFALRTHCS